MTVGPRIHFLLVLVLNACWITRTACNPTLQNIMKRSCDDVTSYLEENWKIWYAALDINRDSKLSIEDRNLCRDGLIGAYNLSSKDREEITLKLDFWWENLIFNGDESSELSADNFIDILRKHYLESKLKFRNNAVILQGIILNAADVNKNGKLSLNETMALYKAFDLYVEHITEEYFNAYKPKNGEVAIEDMEREWADFIIITNSDTNNFIRRFMIKILDLHGYKP